MDAKRPNRYIDPWILGDLLERPAVQDHAMLQILHCHRHHGRGLNPESFRPAWQQTKPGSKLCKWALAQFLFVFSENGIASSWEDEIDVWSQLIEEVEEAAKDARNGMISPGSHGGEPYKRGHVFISGEPRGLKICIQYYIRYSTLKEKRPRKDFPTYNRFVMRSLQGKVGRTLLVGYKDSIES